MDDADDICEDEEDIIEIEPGDQILVNPRDVYAGDGKIVEMAWAGYLVASDGSLIEMDRGIAGVMPLE